MEKFAFMFHPLSIKDMEHVSPIMKYIPDSWIEAAIKRVKPFKVSHITGIKSPTAEVEGWFVGVPLTAKQMVELPEEFVMDRLIEAGKIAQELGAGIVGLGAFTSIVGDAGITIAKNLDIAVTTGNSYTVHTAITGTKEAVRLMGKELSQCKVAIIGASGSIGAACVKLMAPEVAKISIVARRLEPLEELAHQITKTYSTEIEVSSNVAQALKEADIVLTVTSALDFIIDPGMLKPGAVVCDVARPRNVSLEVSQKRKDVLVIEGGVISVPGDVNFNFNFGFPPKTSYACMAETMILALEKRYENFSLGRVLEVDRIREIGTMGERQGFKLAGFRNFERAITAEHIAEVKRCAENALRTR